MTPRPSPADAIVAPCATVTRREFIAGAGALVVTFAAGPLAGAMQSPFEGREGPIDPKQLDSWIAVGADGLVTAHTGKCELGQGMQTAQLQLIAEELAMPISRVRLVECDTAVTPDQGTTSGSQSTPTNFNRRNLALACATAREALIALASAKLSVPVDRLEAVNGMVRTRGSATTGVRYADLIAGRHFMLPLDPDAKRKPAREWIVLGRPIGRVDMAEMATGRTEFVHNVRVPGMLHGRVVRPPSMGASVSAVDEASVAGMPGIVRVVVRKDFVGVVAEKPWQAIQAAQRLRVTWTPGPPLPARATLYDELRRMPAQSAHLVDSGDVDAALAGGSTVLKATYTHPYQMHGSVGSSCAVADVRADRATIWSATQSAYPTRDTVATLIGLPRNAVRVVYRRGSGCYGLNGADTVSYDAALLSQSVGRPVRVQLSRRDEMAWENYGYAYVIDQRVALGQDQGIAAWDYEAWFPALGNRPGYDRPGNVITGFLAGFEPEAPKTGTTTRASGAYRNGSNAAPSYVAGCVNGRCGGTGTVARERVLTHIVRGPFFTGPLRSPSRLQNTFAHECFLDEIAAHVKTDPVEYRLRHLSDERLRAVVSAAAKQANWERRPSPAAPSPGPSVRGRGLACVNYEGDNGYVALVAEVLVDRATGVVTTTRIVIAQDCGPVSNPDGLRNQIEGGALQGLSRALGEEVTWEGSQVTSIDWRSYHVLPLGIDVPAIETVLINRPEAEALGSGETSITVVAAALGNAIFDATGVRLRTVPFTAARVKAALDAAGSRDSSAAGGRAAR